MVHSDESLQLLAVLESSQNSAGISGSRCGGSDYSVKPTAQDDSSAAIARSGTVPSQYKRDRYAQALMYIKQTCLPSLKATRFSLPAEAGISVLKSSRACLRTDSRSSLCESGSLDLRLICDLTLVLDYM